MIRTALLALALSLAACDCGGVNTCEANCSKVPQCFVAPATCAANADCGPHSRCASGKCVSTCPADCSAGKISTQCQSCLQSALGCAEVSACGC